MTAQWGLFICGYLFLWGAFLYFGCTRPLLYASWMMCFVATTVLATIEFGWLQPNPNQETQGLGMFSIVMLFTAFAMLRAAVENIAAAFRELVPRSKGSREKINKSVQI